MLSSHPISELHFHPTLPQLHITGISPSDGLGTALFPQLLLWELTRRKLLLLLLPRELARARGGILGSVDPSFSVVQLGGSERGGDLARLIEKAPERLDSRTAQPDSSLLSIPLCCLLQRIKIFLLSMEYFWLTETGLPGLEMYFW